MVGVALLPVVWWLCWGVTVLDMSVPPGKKGTLSGPDTQQPKDIAAHCRKRRKDFLPKNR
jgi:hypothetical protein